jgi:nitrogen fixation NifU-like protein
MLNSQRRTMLPLVLPLKQKMYPPALIEHFENPRNVGELAPPAITVDVANPACGDTLRLAVRFEDGRAAEVRYKVRGCTASIAAGSALTEWMAGKTRVDLAAFDPAVIDRAVGGLPAASQHAAVLCADGVKTLLEKTIGPPMNADEHR